MRFHVATTVCCLAAVSLAKAEDNAARIDFFEKKIRPVLVTHCYECHSAAAVQAGELKGGLQLDTRDGLLAGGESGRTIVAGKPGESLLLAALKYEQGEMPPEGKLSDAIISDFEKWIADGAYDPRDGNAVAVRRAINFDEARKFWSFRPVSKPTPPDVKLVEWPKNEVDHFILARLEAAHLTPSVDADDRALVRRLYFDLVGLPPTPAEVSSFLAKAQIDRDTAVNELVDKLLASPHFSERWSKKTA